jgi:hypothetical protein
LNANAFEKYAKISTIDKGKDGFVEVRTRTSDPSGSSAGSSISFNSNASYTPNIQNEMKGSNLQIGVKLGPGAFGIFADADLYGFYNIQKIKSKQPFGTKAYGAYNFHLLDDIDESNGFDKIMDFNRESDAIVDKNTHHLPVPIITNDLYNIAGQGVGGLFQANRNTIGYVRDRSLESNSNGGSIGLDFGGGHLGGSATFNHATSNNYLWDLTDFHQNYSFDKSDNEPYHEPTYFKVNGDVSMDDPQYVEAYLNTSTRPSYLPFQISQTNEENSTAFEKKLTTQYELNKPAVKHQPQSLPKDSRRARNANVQAINNEYIHSGDRVLAEFDVAYYNYSGPGVNYNPRTQLVNPVNRDGGYRAKHIGGFTTIGANGSRYVYGLPAYNLKHEQHAFSVAQPNSRDYMESLRTNEVAISGNNYDDYKNIGNQYKDVTELPEYAHAHLLTSVLGTDYVDITNNGPSDDDLGYWVKFNYVKTENYAWRTPYSGASYVPGYLSNPEDDKGHFMYGERENYYLATAETKTHIAVFKISPRHDAKGWSKNGPQSGANSYQLDEINIYSKNEYFNGNEVAQNPIPIKTIHFSYAQVNDELCKEIDNSEVTNGGKLTLTEVWFTYRNNERGALNKYRFDYGMNDVDNPPYSKYTFDCWGNYRDNDNLPSEVQNFVASYPYVPQDFDAGEASTFNDEAAQAWNLKKITTPSGAIIEVTYESDDYAYVQNKKAMQMYALSADQSTGSTTLPYCLSDAPNGFLRDAVGDFVRVDLPSGISENQIPDLFDQIDSPQLYFKVLSPLITKGNTNTSYSEFVSGYADIDMQKTLGQYNLNSSDPIPNNSVKIYLKPFKKGKQGTRYHPITLAVMDFLMLERSDLIYLVEGSMPPTRDLGDDSKEQKRDNLKALIGPIFNMLKFNQNFYSNAACKTGTVFIPGHSYVRLNNMNGFKEGGGIRVKQIEMSESDNATISYGQVYDYTTYSDKWGKTISSGVATYEPNVGGEQNALKRGLTYDLDFKLKSSYKLFTEFPYNESYFPAPSVGYSKVTVKSINTDLVEKSAKDNLNGGNIMDSDYHKNNIARPTTGTTINEFYTAKDYPIYVTATNLGADGSLKENSLNVPIPLLGSIKNDVLVASQGYFIELNDMHGKQKAVHAHGHDEKGIMIEEPYSSVEYSYHDAGGFIINGIEDGRRVTSTVQSLFPDGKVKDMYLGMDYDFFIDVRSSFVNSNSDGQNFNTDFAIFPILSWLPMFNHDKKEMKYVVTNKIIWRTGILKETKVKYENSIVTTKNTHYDAYTGTPVVSEVQNNYDNIVYNLTIPGYWKYEGMGHAYKNLNLKFEGAMVNKDPLEDGQVVNKLFTVDLSTTDYVASKITQHLYPGDEFLVDYNGKFLKAYVMSVSDQTFKIDFDLDASSAPPSGEAAFYLTRSGRRNLLSAQAGSVTSLVNPLIDYSKNCLEP